MKCSITVHLTLVLDIAWLYRVINVPSEKLEQEPVG